MGAGFSRRPKRAAGRGAKMHPKASRRKMTRGAQFIIMATIGTSNIEASMHFGHPITSATPSKDSWWILTTE